MSFQNAHMLWCLFSLWNMPFSFALPPECFFFWNDFRDSLALVFSSLHFSNELRVNWTMHHMHSSSSSQPSNAHFCLIPMHLWIFVEHSLGPFCLMPLAARATLSIWKSLQHTLFVSRRLNLSLPAHFHFIISLSLFDYAKLDWWVVRQRSLCTWWMYCCRFLAFAELYVSSYV